MEIDIDTQARFHEYVAKLTGVYLNGENKMRDLDSETQMTLPAVANGIRCVAFILAMPPTEDDLLDMLESDDDA